VETAVFGGSAGTVTIAGGITAAGVLFDSTGYSLTGSPLTLTTGVVTTSSGVEATVSSAISGSAGLTKQGSGTLTLAGTNAYTGATTVAEGTLKAAAHPGFRYYRFTVAVNFGNDGYNQIGELHYYQNGVWVPAVTGSATGGGTGEQLWSNANDNLGAQTGGFSKYGVGTRPYSITYDFGSAKKMDAYNWSSGNDSTPSRNPMRWTVSGSNDNTNFVVIDDRSNVNQSGPTTNWTWSGATGTYLTNTNTLDGGAANAYPLAFGSVPATSPLSVASGSTFDLNGRNHTAPSLADFGVGGGSVSNTASNSPVTLRLGSTGNSAFTGTISDAGPSNAITLVKVSTGAQTLGGSTSNTYSGETILGGSGKLILAKTSGAIAIPGSIRLSSTAFGGNNSGVVLAGDEQIADAAIVTWTNSGYGLAAAGNAIAPQSDSFFRLNGHTETVGGLVSGGNGGLAVVENRGFGDVASYGSGTLVLNVTGSNTFSYIGGIRDVDGGSGGGNIGITKTGTGTQILSGGMSSCTGPALIEEGVLRLGNALGSATVTVTDAGTLDGTGSLSGALTVQSGGVFAPGVGGVGTFTCGSPVNIASGGTLSLTGSSILTGVAIIGDGGTVQGTGTISGSLSVQSGGNLSPGTAGIGNLKANSLLSLSGNATFEINKSGASLTSDLASGFSSVTYGGTLTIVATGDTPVLGDSFQLFNPGAGGTFSGAFSSIAGLPTLPSGLQWETTTLLSNGRITVVDKASTPSISPGSGGYVGAQSVTITSDSGSTIYYTLDGTDPNPSSLTGTSPITGIIVPVDSVGTIKAYAVASGFSDSPITTTVLRTVTVPKWNVDANGNWSTPANWINEVIPSGSGFEADFTFAQSANTTVTLDSNRTVGSLVFGNANPITWTLASGSSSILTLNVPSGMPEIETQDVATTISSVLAGSQGFAKTGPGTLTLTGSNTYVGTTAINGGVLSVPTLALNGTNSPLGAGNSISMDGGTLRYTGTASIGNPTFNRAITLGENGGTIDASTPAGFWFVAGQISGSGSFTKLGSRQLIIQSDNTYDGDTFINEAEVQIRTLTSLGSSVGKTVVANGARLAAGGGLIGTITENLVLSGTGGGNGALQANDGGTDVIYSGTVELASTSGIGGGSGFVISGAISGDGGLLKLSGNAVTLSGAGSNTYLGTTTLGGNGKLVLSKTGGAIAISGDLALSSESFNGNNSGVVLAASEQIADTAIVTWTSTSQSGNTQRPSYLRLNGFTETVGGLVASGNPSEPVVENRGLNDAGAYGTGTLIIDTAADTTFSYNGGIRNTDGGTGGGTIALIKTGAGTQALSGGLPFTGGITVSEGTLMVNSITASAIEVDAGTLKGTGGTSSNLTVDAGAILAPGASAGNFSAGNTVLAGTYECEIDGAAGDRLTVSGSLDLTGATLEFDVLSTPTAPSYVIASYTTDLIGTFSVGALPAGYKLEYVSAAKEIRLVEISFAGWASLAGLSGVPDADFDNDGLADAVEYVLGTSPVSANAGGPTASVVDGELVFTFVRSDASLTADVSVSVEVGTDLATWPDTYQVGVDTVSSDEGIEVTDNGATDSITLTVSQGLDEKKFARLVVTVAP
jgi:autotransporter-associated beta strand protein